MPTEPNHSSLNNDDKRWLKLLDDQYGTSQRSIQLRREAVLRELRIRLDADYIMWAVMQGDRKTGEAATLEFFDDAANETPQEQQRWRTWTRIASDLNILSETNEIFVELTKQPPYHFTVFKRELLSRPWKPSVRTVVDKALKGIAITRWWATGLNDLMFTLYHLADQGDVSYGSGIGYHRLKGKRPFDQHDQELAHEVSYRHPWIHGVGVDTRFRAFELSRPLRMLFPFLLRNYKIADIAKILAKSPKTIDKQIQVIAEKMGLHSEDHKHLRSAICEYCKLRVHPDVPAGDATTQLRDGLKSLEEESP